MAGDPIGFCGFEQASSRACPATDAHSATLLGYLVSGLSAVMRLEGFKRPVVTGDQMNSPVATDQDRHIRGDEPRAKGILRGIEDLGGVLFEQAHA